jgi:DNA (cytosine-5)-methyltransferase 1
LDIQRQAGGIWQQARQVGIFIRGDAGRVGRGINFKIDITMTHISLFSGIGGFDLAAEWMGWKNVAHCEINPFGQQVLKYYWPESEMIEDVHDIDKFKKYAGTIDIISGGFPCQPYSQAGKRLGKEDDRHLWPQMLRIIREVRPKWVVGENVLGLTNWNGGMVFDEVQADLEAEGYEVQAYVLPACGVNAPHRRDRVWFVGRRYVADPGLQRQAERQEQPMGTEQFCEKRTAADTNDKRLERQTENRNMERKKRFMLSIAAREQRWDNFPTQFPICQRNDGISSRLSGITFPKWRNEAIKAMGNAIVPQVVYQIFKAIAEYEK